MLSPHLPLFPTAVVGSLPRPRMVRELINDPTVGGASQSSPHDHPMNTHRTHLLNQAVAYAIALQQAAGVDIVSDGEWRRLSYIGIIAELASGFEFSVQDGKSWHTVVAPMRLKFTAEEVARDHTGPLYHESEFLLARAQAPWRCKIALPSPYLLGERMWDPERSRAAYPTKRDFTEALVPILQEAVRLLAAIGVRFVQIDDPHLCLLADPDVRASIHEPENEAFYAVGLVNRVLKAAPESVHTAVHLCRRNKGRAGWVGQGDYEPLLWHLMQVEADELFLEFAIPAAGELKALAGIPKHMRVGIGCIDVRQPEIPTPEAIVERIVQATHYVEPARITLVPDCGFAPGSAHDIPLEEAYQKLCAMTDAARILRARFG